MKNRGLPAQVRSSVESVDTAGFLHKTAGYDAQLNAQKRTQLIAPQKALLNELENQMVALTGYLVLAYPGPPETCNCADKNLHDFHLEIFEESSNHHPQVGDPTPIICEVTPRTEQSLFRDGVRLLSLAGFFRNQKQYIPSNHPPQRIRVTGYLMWDDEHNGSADIGTTVQYITPGNGFHHPWRSTAWEIHPVIKIELAGAAETTQTHTPPPPSPVPTPGSMLPGASTATTPTLSTTVLLIRPVALSTSRGVVTLPAGTRLPVISGTATTLRVQYLDQQFDIPVSATGAAH